MKFVGREKNVNEISDVLCMPCKKQSIWFQVTGGSGCGKTHLIKEAVSKAVEDSNDIFCVYIDVVSDEYVANNFFENLIQQVYIPINHHYENVTTIPKKFSLSDYAKKQNLKNASAKMFFGVTDTAISSIPKVGKYLSSAWESVADFVKNNQLIPVNILFTYLKSIIKKHRVNIIIDNYQFVPSMIKRQFEASINEFNTGISVISIVRTLTDESITENYCDNFQKITLDIHYISEEECKLLLQAQNSGQFELNEDEIEKIWLVTKGNLKNLELILNEIRVNPGYSIISAQNTIQNLDAVQKSILWIAALFPAGLRENYVISAIQDILNEDDSDKIKEKVLSLIQLGYIYLNGSSNDAIKPTHETVINNIKNIMDNHDSEYFRNALAHSLESLIYNNIKTADYAYLIHCWIGISTSEELCNNIAIIEELISIKFKENAYYYIDDIAIKIKDILFYFNDIVLKKILISFQRISDFQTGLTLLHYLKKNNNTAYQKLEIFYAKYLIQTYNFEDAIEVLNEMTPSTETLLCQLNAFQHLGKDDSVKYLLQTELPFCEKTENYYIILRNTAHYFSYEEAIENLECALEYFEKKSYSEFTIATVANNLGVVALWRKEYDLAKTYLKKAESKLESLKSNEIFEPLCNQSICALLTADYDNAIFFAKKALDHCPRTLSLDMLMLQINKAVIELCRGDLSLEITVDFLRKLINDNSIIDDPWYRFQLQYNFSQLSHLLGKSKSDYAVIYIDEYYDGLTKYYMLETFAVNEHEIKLCLGLSPNWRY